MQMERPRGAENIARKREVQCDSLAEESPERGELHDVVFQLIRTCVAGVLVAPTRIGVLEHAVQAMCGRCGAALPSLEDVADEDPERGPPQPRASWSDKTEEGSFELSAQECPVPTPTSNVECEPGCAYNGIIVIVTSLLLKVQHVAVSEDSVHSSFVPFTVIWTWNFPFSLGKRDGICSMA